MGATSAKMKRAKQTKLEKELEQTIYGSRMLVVLETPDGFAQVMFDKKQFKKVSDLIASFFPKHDCGEAECIAMEISEDLIPTDTFDGMSDFE